MYTWISSRKESNTARETEGLLCLCALALRRETCNRVRPTSVLYQPLSLHHAEGQKTQKVGLKYEAEVCFVLVTPVHFIGLSERPRSNITTIKSDINTFARLPYFRGCTKYGILLVRINTTMV
jgi:hypothetical protein